MISYSLVFIAGLVCGWVVIPQPKWVKPLYDKLKAKWRNRNAD